MLETGLGASINLALATLPGCTLPTVNLSSDRWYHEDIVTPRLEKAASGTIIPASLPYLGRQVDAGLVQTLTLAKRQVRA